jgi:hypothetical protein
MIGTSPELSSTMALSMPSPANADSRCSTVEILTSPSLTVVPSVVSETFSARARTTAGVSRSVRTKEIPAFAAAGRNTISTFLPVCRPTPVARIEFLSVRCLSIGVLRAAV